MVRVYFILFIYFLLGLQVLYADNVGFDVKLDTGGQPVEDWRSCPEDEMCYRASRVADKKFQYPIQVTARVVPGQRYRFSYTYKMRREHKATFFVFYKDSKKEYIRDASGSIHTDKTKLSASQHSDRSSLVFEPPRGSKYALIYLRLEGEKVFTLYMSKAFSLQRIAASPELVFESEVDPVSHILTGTVKVKYSKQYKSALVILQSPSRKIKYLTKVNEPFQINLHDYFQNNEEISVDIVSENLRIHKKFINYNTAPYTNKFGLLKRYDQPPKPWTPLSWDPRYKTITTWNHKISVNDFLEITSVKLRNLNNRDLFTPRGSPKLLLNGNDIKDIVQAGRITIVLDSPNKIILKNQLYSPQVDMDITMEISYDGLVKYGIVLKPKTKIKTFQLSYKQNEADWQMYNDGSWKHYKLSKIRRKKKLSMQRFYPYVWSGNQEYGIYWMAEKLYPSINPQRVWHHVSREQGTQIELITKTLRERTRIDFALGITPARPEKKASQTDPLVFRTEGISNFDLIWSSPSTSKYFGFPKRARGFDLASKKSKKIKLLSYYQAATYCMDSIPEWDYYQKEWKNFPTHTYDFSKTFHAKAKRVDISSRSWQDFYLAKLRSFLNKNPELNSLYFDVMQLHLSKRGDEYIYPVFDMRAFFERIYVMQKELDSNAWFFLHSSPSIFGVGAPFADIMMSGEEYHVAMKKHRFYLEAISIDTFRMQFATNSGAKRMFLAQYGKVKGVKQDIGRAVHAVGLSMLHNLLLYPNYLHSKTVFNMQSKKVQFFGKHPYYFVPYWKLEDQAEESVKTSSYIQKDSERVLLVVFNTSGEQKHFSLPPIPAGYHVLVYNPLNNSTKQTRSFLLKPYMCKLVMIEPN